MLGLVDYIFQFNQPINKSDDLLFMKINAYKFLIFD